MAGSLALVRALRSDRRRRPAQPPPVCERRCVLLRGAAIDSVGTLDERFFLYAEETDWQLARALKAG